MSKSQQEYFNCQDQLKDDPAHDDWADQQDQEDQQQQDEENAQEEK